MRETPKEFVHNLSVALFLATLVLLGVNAYREGRARENSCESRGGQIAEVQGRWICAKVEPLP